MLSISRQDGEGKSQPFCMGVEGLAWVGGASKEQWSERRSLSSMGLGQGGEQAAVGQADVQKWQFAEKRTGSQQRRDLAGRKAEAEERIQET